jgi:hypothetical protein
MTEDLSKLPDADIAEMMRKSRESLIAERATRCDGRRAARRSSPLAWDSGGLPSSWRLVF